MQEYILFLDIDGTVLGQNGIHQRTVDALHRAAMLGHKIFINTGRPHCCIPKAVLDALLPDGVVGATGTVITLGEKVIFSTAMAWEDVLTLGAFAEERGLYTTFEGKDGIFVLNGDAIWNGSCPIASLAALCEIKPRPVINKISFFHAFTEWEAAELLSVYPEACVHREYAELPSRGCNKATAIARVCAHYGSDVAHTIAFGDSLNDIEMLEGAGIGVAMGNALPKIKEVADLVTAPCDEGGVGLAVEHLLLNGLSPMEALQIEAP